MLASPLYFTYPLIAILNKVQGSRHQVDTGTRELAHPFQLADDKSRTQNYWLISPTSLTIHHIPSRGDGLAET